MSHLDYSNKIERLTEHLREHPSDYQGVISLYKLKSMAIEHEMHLASIEKQRMIAECRRKLKGEANEESTFE